MDKKVFYKSKTFWFNGLTVVVVGAAAFGYTPDPEVSQAVSKLLLASSPVINLVLRYFTNKGVTLR